MPASVLHNPHPAVRNVDAARFDYAAYAWRHVTVALDEFGVLLLTLSRPERHNAYTNEMCHDIVFALELADADPRVKAVVMTGAGKSYCAGADLAGGFGASDPSLSLNQHRDGGGQASGAVLRCRKLVVAAVNGNAVGVGITMILPADLRLVSKDAKVGLPFTKRGITLEGMSAYILPRLVGHANALEIAMTGDIYPATSPKWAQLWNQVLPAEEVLPTALALARRLAQENSVVSMALNKQLLWRTPDSPEATHLLDSKCIYETSRGDAQEGIKSFLEKRKARFPGTMKDLERFGFYPWWTQPDIEGTKTRGLAKL